MAPRPGAPRQSCGPLAWPCIGRLHKEHRWYHRKAVHVGYLMTAFNAWVRASFPTNRHLVSVSPGSTFSEPTRVVSSATHIVCCASRVFSRVSHIVGCARHRDLGLARACAGCAARKRPSRRAVCVPWCFCSVFVCVCVCMFSSWASCALAGPKRPGSGGVGQIRRPHRYCARIRGWRLPIVGRGRGAPIAPAALRPTACRRPRPLPASPRRWAARRRRRRWRSCLSRPRAPQRSCRRVGVHVGGGRSVGCGAGALKRREGGNGADRVDRLKSPQRYCSNSDTVDNPTSSSSVLLWNEGHNRHAAPPGAYAATAAALATEARRRILA